MTATASRIDVGALTAAIKNEAMSRVAGAFVATRSRLEDDDHRLTEAQEHAFIEYLLECFDGFERKVYREIKQDLEDAHVEVWGAPRELEDA